MKRKIVANSDSEDGGSSDAEQQQAVRRSERPRASRLAKTAAAPKKSALELLEEIENEDEDEVGVWKEETEDERQRRLNFVVDDDGTGYVDEDLEYGGREYAQLSDDEDADDADQADPTKKKRKKVKKLGDVNARAELQKNTILDMFAKSAARRTKADEAEQARDVPEIKAEDLEQAVDDSLADILVSSTKAAKRPAPAKMSRPVARPSASMSAPRPRASIPPATATQRPRASIPSVKAPAPSVVQETPSYHYDEGPDFSNVDVTSNDENAPAADERAENAAPAATEASVEPPASAQAPAQPVVETAPAPAPKMSARSKLLALASSVPLPASKPTVVEEKMAPVPAEAAETKKAVLELSLKAPELATMTSTTMSESTSAQSIFPTVPLGEDKAGKEAIEFYWLDMWDTNNSPGLVYVFGRVATGDANAPTASAVVALRNVQRCLYFTPRPEFAQGDENRKVLQEEALNAIRQRLDPEKRDHVRFRSKWVTRNYAFELPDIPRGASDYLMVQYSMALEMSNLDSFAPGRTFAHVFGANQTCIERFILANKLMGPCWLNIEAKVINKEKTGRSHAKFEAEIDLEAPGSVLTIVQKPPPTVSVLSLALKTVVDPVSHHHLIVAATGVLHPEVALDASKIATTKDAVVAFQLVRPLNNESLPPGFSSQNPNVTCLPNERALLSLLLAKLHMIDPDFLMGHNIEGFELDLILTRTRFLKISQWSKIGRLNLREHPRLKKAAGGRSSHWGVLTPGRLLLDTYKSAQEFVMGQREYSLSSLCENLGLTPPNRRRVDVDPASVPEYFKTRENLSGLMRHNIETAQLALELAFKLEAFSLTFELTTIAGNLWRRTLGAGRAERIEYLLLHAFHNLDYIVPDKEDFNKRKSSSKKAGYLGGLVLEPKAALYDTFIVLLDFNALYPSIIQEYNICFTTVARPAVRDDDDHDKSHHSKKAKHADENGEENPEDEAMDVDGEAGEDGGNAPEDDDEVPLPSDNGRGPNGLAVLPRVIKGIVDRRVSVKNQLSSENDPMKRRQLDTRQKALKITANSMYGCLGFSASRFFAKPLASLITSRGRLILQDTVETTRQLGYDVVYGDTDSIMIDTRLRPENSPLVPKDLESVGKIAEEVQKSVNPKYKYLKIALDGVFGTLLLLKKKKYAALSVSIKGDSVITKRETKGLDLVRRDWCLASRDVGSTVLDLILSGKSRDDVIEEIRSVLMQFKEDARGGKITVDKWAVTKGLNKSPRDYPDVKGQPHLQVALAMMTKGKVVNTGDHIPYVICTKSREDLKREQASEGTDGAPLVSVSSTSKGSFADRAFHPDEVKELGLTIDIDWYLVTQILPPVQRLCEVIDGVTSVELAEALGLDATKFKGTNNMSIGSIQSAISTNYDEVFGSGFAADRERFKHCERIQVECSSCSLSFDFPGVMWLPEEKKRALGEDKIDESLQLLSGDCCPKCHATVVDGPVLQNLLRLAARKAIMQYYRNMLVSDDPTASDLLTRQQSLRNMYSFNGKRVQLHRKYTAKDLWIQLLYLASLVDYPRAQQSLKKENEHRRKSGQSTLIENVSQEMKEAMPLAKKFMEDTYLKKSKFGWVGPAFFSKVFRLAPPPSSTVQAAM